MNNLVMGGAETDFIYSIPFVEISRYSSGFLQYITLQDLQFDGLRFGGLKSY